MLEKYSMNLKVQTYKNTNENIKYMRAIRIIDKEQYYIQACIEHESH